jgi:hypothetical protein
LIGNLVLLGNRHHSRVFNLAQPGFFLANRENPVLIVAASLLDNASFGIRYGAMHIVKVRRPLWWLFRRIE